jgi:hypothetical protein
MNEKLTATQVNARQQAEIHQRRAHLAAMFILAKVLRTYRETQDAIGDSDLDREQPRTLPVPFTLGELRDLEMWSQFLGLPREGTEI